MQETVRQKDQSIRKYEQEIDSLQFRNDQVSWAYLSKQTSGLTLSFLSLLQVCLALIHLNSILLAYLCVQRSA